MRGFKEESFGKVLLAMRPPLAGSSVYAGLLEQLQTTDHPTVVSVLSATLCSEYTAAKLVTTCTCRCRNRILTLYTLWCPYEPREYP